MPEPEVTREDLKRVETRLEFAGQEVEGEKLVSRYVLEQSRGNGDDLAVLKTRADRLEGKVDRIETELRALRSDFTSSHEKLPGLIADVMREVLRESRGKE